MPLNGIQSHHLQSVTKTDKGDIATRKRRRGFAPRIQVEHDSSSDEAPTSSRSIYLWEIHRHIVHNEMLQRLLVHSTKLLRDAERIAMGEGNAPAPQAVRPLALALPNAHCPYYTAQLEANQLKQVPWPPSAAYAAGQGYAA
jgi:hypothetical protein